MRCDRGTESTITGSLQQHFDGSTWTILVEAEVFWRAKVVGISVSKPGGPNFVREEVDAYGRSRAIIGPYYGSWVDESFQRPV